MFSISRFLPLFFFFFFKPQLLTILPWTVHGCTVHGSHKLHFLTTFLLKMDPKELFIHLKIILLQCFQFSAKISCIQTDHKFKFDVFFKSKDFILCNKNIFGFLSSKTTFSIYYKIDLVFWQIQIIFFNNKKNRYDFFKKKQKKRLHS